LFVESLIIFHIRCYVILLCEDFTRGLIHSTVVVQSFQQSKPILITSKMGWMLALPSRVII
jgi:hypothetical protein